MGLDEAAELGDVVGLRQGVGQDLVIVEPQVEVVVFIQHIGDAAGHARREVLSRGPQDDAAAAGHVLAAVVSQPSTHGTAPELRTQNRSPAISVDERLAGGGAVQGTLPAMMFSPGSKALPWGDRAQLSAGEALAEPSLQSPSSSRVTPLGRKAPKDWPPPPRQVMT